MGFNEEYNKIFELVKADISKVSEELQNSISIKEPLYTPLNSIISAPSKHIRALSAFLYLRANNINIDLVHIKLQAAVELIHNASLIHDDIIDESSTRRNEKTLNTLFDNKLAVLAGDYLLAAALNKLDEIKNFEVTGLFSEIMKTMCLGEINQYFARYKTVTIEEYIDKSRSKTASLFQAAIEGSAILSGMLSRVEAKEFALNLGIAFQIRDDLINYKTTRTDLQSGIYTAPVILGQTSGGSDGIEKTLRLLNNYIDKSFDLLDKIENNTFKEALVALLELLKHE